MLTVDYSRTINSSLSITIWNIYEFINAPFLIKVRRVICSICLVVIIPKYVENELKCPTSYLIICCFTDIADTKCHKVVCSTEDILQLHHHKQHDRLHYVRNTCFCESRTRIFCISNCLWHEIAKAFLEYLQPSLTGACRHSNQLVY